MKSLQLKKYGGITEVLQFKEVKQEIPKDNEVLIKVEAVGLNPIDIKIAKGDLRAIIPSITKKPKLGFDISGIVMVTGEKVTSFQEGDEVFVRLPLHQGSGFSEFVTSNPNHVALKPSNTSFEEAASLPLVALTSIQALKDYAKAKARQRILIDSGSGGVGTFAIQYAKHLGLNVTAITSSKNKEFLEKLEVDNVICYDVKNPEKINEKYDIVFNIISGINTFKSVKLAKKGGVIVSIGGPPDIRFIPKLKIYGVQKLLLYPLFGLSSLTINLFALLKGVKYYRFLTQSNGKQLEEVTELVEKKKVNPLIDKVYPLNKYKEAFEYLKTNRVKGKLILNHINNRQ